MYAVYWDPGAWFHHEWVSNIDGFLQKLGASGGEYGTIFSTLSQYRDRSNAGGGDRYVFKGAYSDTAPYPAGKCTDPEPLEFGQRSRASPTPSSANSCRASSPPTDAEGDERDLLRADTPRRGGLPGRSLDELLGLQTEPTERTRKAIAKARATKTASAATTARSTPKKPPRGTRNTVLYAAIPWTAGYEGHPWDFAPGACNAGQAYDCQDGGWNPENGEEKFEIVQAPMSTSGSGTVRKGHARRKRSDRKRAPPQRPAHRGAQPGRTRRRRRLRAGLSDVIVNQIAEEQANIVTDPLLNSLAEPGHRQRGHR